MYQKFAKIGSVVNAVLICEFIIEICKPLSFILLSVQKS